MRTAIMGTPDGQALAYTCKDFLGLDGTATAGTAKSSNNDNYLCSFTKRQYFCKGGVYRNSVNIVYCIYYAYLDPC